MMKTLAIGLIVLAVLIFLAVRWVSATAPQPGAGEVAPDFESADQHGERIRLSDFRGRQWVILYFYPKDDTPGCTKEACSFRDHLPRLQSLNAAVLGISVDGPLSHKRFAEKYRLNFPILIDDEYRVARGYGVLKNFLGLKLARRMTWIIDPAGIIRKVYGRVKPKAHAIEVARDLEKLRAMGSGPGTDSGRRAVGG